MEYKDLEFITPEKIVGVGSTAKCYLLTNNKVFKEFNEPCDRNMIYIYKELAKFKNDSILFPEELVYDDKKFYGYTVEYVKGKTFGRAFATANLDDLAYQSIKLEDDIKNISNDHLLMDDLFEGNIMYDGNKIKVIDTDYYDIMDDLSENEINKMNVSYYKRTIYHCLSNNIEMCLANNMILDKAQKYRRMKISGSEMLDRILSDLQNEYGSDIRSINDANMRRR